VQEIAINQDCHRHQNPHPAPLRTREQIRGDLLPERCRPYTYQRRSTEGSALPSYSFYLRHGMDQALRSSWLSLWEDLLNAPSPSDAVTTFEAFRAQDPDWCEAVLDYGRGIRLKWPHRYGDAHRPSLLGVPIEFPPSRDPDPVEMAIECDLVAAVHAGLDSLPPRQRRAVSLRVGLESLPCAVCGPLGRCCACHGDPPTYTAIANAMHPGGSVSGVATRALVRRGLSSLSKHPELEELGVHVYGFNAA
jgi:hypothetical protein